MDVVFVNLDQQALAFQFFDDLWPGLRDFLAGEFAGHGQEPAVPVDDLLFFQVMPFGDVKIDRRMPGRDRHHPGPEFHVDNFVFYDSGRYRAVDPFQFDLLPLFVVGISFIVWVHHDIFVAEFCFRPHRPDHKGPVLNVIKRVFLLHELDLDVRQGSAEFRIPVDNPFAAVHQAVLMHFYESFLDFFDDVFIEGEFFPRPVAGRSQAPDIVFHVGTISHGKLPDLLV